MNVLTSANDVPLRRPRRRYSDEVGYRKVVAATGMARNTVMAGMQELDGSSNEFLSATPLAAAGSTRRSGGGRKPATHKDPGLVPDLLALVDATSRGDPESPLRWTCKSLRVLADELKAGGHAISHVVVGRLLKDEGYSLQANAKVIEGNQSPDRNAQFEHINARVSAALAAGQPVISVDTKKKEMVGRYKNGGREWHPEGEPEEVRVHDFVDPELGRANPYGVYDIGADEGWVSVGTDHDTSAFAVQTIRRWWFSMGRPALPEGQGVDHHRGWRRQQRLQGSVVEAGVGPPRNGDGPTHSRMPLPAWHQQVEQDRASPVLLHHDELAWSPAGQS